MNENAAPPPPCDVLHIVWSGFFGGVQTQLAALVRGMRGRPGATHQVCFLEGVGGVGDDLVAEGLGFRLGFRRGWGPRELWRFSRSLKQVRPSVIHFHSPVLGATLIAVWVSNADCVFTQHNPAPLRRTLRYRIFYRLFRRKFVRFVLPTPAIRQNVEGYGIDPDRIVVLPYALAVPSRIPTSTDRKGEQRLVGVAARLEQVKRLDVFIDVIAELRKRGVDCRAVILGEGSKRAELEEHVRKLGLDGLVQLVGVHTDVTEWLDRFDVCLMTSEAEIFGMIAIEAMARGVPLVAMPCAGGLPDLAARGGLLLADREPSTAAAALVSLFESPETRDELRARGAEVASEHAIGTVITAYDEFYRDLDSNARPK